MAQPGTLIEGKYEILGKIREGGMGAIYKVRHRLLDEIRVIKVMRPQILSSEEMKRRFVEEARTATKLKHPNICTIYDFALDEDGTAYLVMEFIDGVTMAELLHSPTPPGVGMTLEIAHQSLLALGYLHRKNVVHRDVAPDNLMLTSDEEGQPIVKLIDLGIAKALDNPGGDMTSTGVFLGKLKYASPEQYGALPSGQKIDGRSDLYCLGVVMYELLTGERPFAGETPAEMLRAHLFQPPIPFLETDKDEHVPQELRAAVLRALEKKREDRYASAEDFDREILRLRAQLLPASAADATVAFVSSARASRGILTPGITPSAQDRLDRRFGAHPTPAPSKPGLSGRAAMDSETTALAPGPPTPARESTGGARRAVIAAAVVVGMIAAFAVWRSGRERSSSASAAPAAPAAPIAENAPNTAASPGGRAPTETPPPSAVPVAVTEAPAPTQPPPSPVPTPARRPTAAPRIRPTPPPPRREPSEVVAQRADRPTLPAAAPPLAAGVPIAAPTRVLVPTPRPAALSPVAASEPGAAPTETRSAAAPPEPDRIRETIRRYERAQNTLDADLYSRVYPGANRARVQAAFENFRSQSVTFDQIRIDWTPGSSRAVAHLHERRVAVPKVGSEQHLDGDRTITLRKEGDAWVIAGLQ